MGIYIELLIKPNLISANDWKNVYTETLKLVNNWENVAIRYKGNYVNVDDQAYERTSYSKELEYTQEEDKKHWHIVGDIDSFQTAESFLFYQDISNYHKKKNSNTEIIDDLIHERDDEYVCVFNSKTQGYPYHFILLAVSMLVEARFQDKALVSGDIDIYQEQRAQKLIKTILKEDIPISLAVDADKLITKIKKHVSGDEAIKAFNRIFRGKSNSEVFSTIFKNFPETEVKQWFIDRLKNSEPDQVSVVEYFISWFNAGRDLRTLCQWACSDNEGVKYDKLKFSHSLASTWISIKPEFYAHLKEQIKKEGEAETIDGLLGMVLAVFSWQMGKNCEVYIPPKKVKDCFLNLFPENAEEMIAVYEKAIYDFKAKLKKDRPQAQEDSKHEPSDKDWFGKSLLNIKDSSQLDETGKYILNSIAKNLYKNYISAKSENEEFYTKILNMSSSSLWFGIFSFCRQKSIILLEDAWKWIDEEKDKEILLIVFFILSVVKEIEGIFHNVTMVILSKKFLCQQIKTYMNDKDLIKEWTR